MVLVAIATAVPADSPPAKSESKPAGPPPLEVEEDTPLLLDEPSKPEKPAGKSGKPPADNSACYVCHANLEVEQIVTWHVGEGTGCIDCHGPSFAHRNDENNTTPPDIMLSRDKIDRTCSLQCHEMHNAPAAKVLTRFFERFPKNTDPATIVCTDCHGDHRLKVRTVRWNKQTGELIEVSKEKGVTPARP